MHNRHRLMIQDELSQQYLSSKLKAILEVSPRNSMFEVASINRLSLMTICAFATSKCACITQYEYVPSDDATSFRAHAGQSLIVYTSVC